MNANRWHSVSAAVTLLFLTCVWPIPAAAQTNWSLVWSDEFDGPSGAAPDSSKWMYDRFHAGDSNHELQLYCGEEGDGRRGVCSDYVKNAHMDGRGNLVISAVLTHPAKAMQGGPPSKDQWTSARLLTHNKFTFTYGRAEARIKLPFGAGIWPAFWALGDNISSVGWPASGELDMMENVPQLGPDTIRSSLHGPGYNGGNSLHGDYKFPAGGRVDTDFHLYGVIWTPDLVQYYVDDDTHPFVSFTPADMPANADSVWAFGEHPFFLLLNLAIGGDWPAPPDASTPSPANMYVDYVRVYQGFPPFPKNLTAQAAGDGIVNLTWNATGAEGATYSVYGSANNGFRISPETLLAEKLLSAFYTAALPRKGRYYFRVTVTDMRGISQPSQQASAEVR
jgi:beta-glucanase (GH16 family)